MMRPHVRKQTQSDFHARLRVVERGYKKRTPLKFRRDRDGERPLFCAVTSYAWTYLALYIATNRTIMEAALAGSRYSEQVQLRIMQGAAAFLMASVILLMFHFLRALSRRRRYYNSGAVLSGFFLAGLMYVLPDETYDSAFELLGPDTREAMRSASEQARRAGSTVVSYALD